MKKIEINETPVRTSRNFNINNIKIENIEIPEKIKQFKNVHITGETSKINIDNDTSNIKLVYGLSEFLTNQVINYANQKLRLIIDSKTNKETQIEFKFDKENTELVDDIEVVANEGTKATIIIKYALNEDIQVFHNGIIRVNAKQNSNVKIILVNLINSKSENFISIENNFEANAKVNYTIVDFGGKHSITNYYSNLIGENSDNSLNTIYLGKENQLFDLNYIAELRGVKTNIDIDVQGALKDIAR